MESGYNFNQSPSELIRRSRAIKEESINKGIWMEGRPGKPLIEIEAQVTAELEKMFKEHKNWIDENEKKIAGIVADCGPEKIHKSFTDGLSVFFRQQYRLVVKEIKDAPEAERGAKKEKLALFTNPKFIKDQIFAYAFDFTKSLRMSQEAGRPSILALKIAKLSYRHNPDVIEKLKNKYPETDYGTITRAVVGTPSIPEKYIKDFDAKVTELRPLYEKKVGINIIKLFVRSHPAKKDKPKNIEEHLEEFIIEFDKYKDEFKDKIHESAIKAIVAENPKNARMILEGYKKKVDDLYTIYHINKGIIRYAMLARPGQTKKFIENYIEWKGYLDNKYKNKIDSNVIRNTLLRHSSCFKKKPGEEESNVEKILDRYIVILERLTANFKESPKLLKFAAIRHQSDPEKYLNELKSGHSSENEVDVSTEEIDPTEILSTEEDI